MQQWVHRPAYLMPSLALSLVTQLASGAAVGAAAAHHRRARCAGRQHACHLTACLPAAAEVHCTRIWLPAIEGKLSDKIKLIFTLEFARLSAVAAESNKVLSGYCSNADCIAPRHVIPGNVSPPLTRASSRLAPLAVFDLALDDAPDYLFLHLK
jgi:hypothetical protein